jgi:hypothetical protein
MQNNEEPKEWTLMFYMASDNPLVVSIVSQLKALKAAGFHPDVNVVVQFDPYAEGTPTHIFDVNLINKLKSKHSKSNIGFADNPTFVRNLIEDKLWRAEITRRGKLVRQALDDVIQLTHHVPYLAPMAPDMTVNGNNGHDAQSDNHAYAEQNGSQNGHGNGKSRELGPYDSLLNFLYFCSANYKAKHYMLFIIGHGVVVGNDIFLFDSHAEEHSITLAKMGEALQKFKDSIAKGSSFDLVSFNSCSVSSLEVAYELQGIAHYMLASQGPTFVGSWPYREILIRIFREVEERKGNIRELISDIYHYCFYNSADYLLAGYSSQLTLCDLSRVSDLNKPMERLTTALIQALSPDDKKKNDVESTLAILHSHLKSQSFFDEMYTDLYDFCFCIVDRCERIEIAGGYLTPQLAEIREACDDVLKVLAKPEVKEEHSTDAQLGKISDTPTLITASDYLGPAYQYSRGLSVYFPWSRPTDDSQIMQDYETYKFHTEFKDRAVSTNSWFDFLEAYFIATERETKKEEIRLQLLRQQQKCGQLPDLTLPEETFEQELQELQEDIGNLIYSGEGPLDGLALADKTDPWDKTGDDCKCASIKNYPRDTRARKNRRRQAQKMPFTDSLLGEFRS